MPLLLLFLCLFILPLTGTVVVADDSELASPGYTITVLGDSLTAGYGLVAEDSFPAQLENALRAKEKSVRVINSGVSGDTTAGGLSRTDWVLADSPDLLVIALGANDALRGFEPESTRKNLAAIIEKALARGIKVLLIGMKAPRNFGPAYYTEFDRIYRDLASTYAIPLYPFFLEGVATDASLNQRDGIHPNRAGVEIMVRNILPLIEAIIGSRTTGSRPGRPPE